MRKTTVWIAVLGLITIVGNYAFIAFNKNDSLEKSFGSISADMSRQDVSALMGVPDLEREGCRDKPMLDDHPVVGKVCASELQYSARLLPKFWTIGFDGAGKAVAKYEYVSP